MNPSNSAPEVLSGRAELLDRHPWLTFLLPFIVYMLAGDNNLWTWDQTFWTNTGKFLTNLIANDDGVFGRDADGKIWHYEPGTGGGWTTEPFDSSSDGTPANSDSTAIDDRAILLALDEGFQADGREKGTRPE